MKITNTLLAVAVVAIVACVPATTHAYYTTGQTAVKLDDHNALFIIEYTFSNLTNDLYMPTVSKRASASVSIDEKVAYTLTNKDKSVQTEGTALGAVLSGAPIVNGMYKIDKGTAHKLWLAVVVTTPDSSKETNYALQVTQLPYYLDEGKNGLLPLHLNPSELQYYVTKGITLNGTKVK